MWNHHADIFKKIFTSLFQAILHYLRKGRRAREGLTVEGGRDGRKQGGRKEKRTREKGERKRKERVVSKRNREEGREEGKRREEKGKQR